MWKRRGTLNTVENVFSAFKRGMLGVYQHCDEAHLHRYLAEFDFRYDRRAALKVTDSERHDPLLAAIGGKRPTYRGGMVKPVAPRQRLKRLQRIRKNSNKLRGNAPFVR